MNAHLTFKWLTPPARRLTPKATIDGDKDKTLGRREKNVLAYFSNLTDGQARLIHEVLPELSEIMKIVRAEHLEACSQYLHEALKLPLTAVNELNKQAWAHERWRTEILNSIDSLTLDKAEVRCEGTPWDPLKDLLVLPHYGRYHVPLFQFDIDSGPNQAWIALLAALRAERRYEAWEEMAWVLKPNLLFNSRRPVDVLYEDTRKVIQVARSASQEGEL